MDRDQNPNYSPRKARFTPKPRPRRKLKPIISPKTEAEDDDDEAAKALLQRVNERLGKRGTKVEKKSSVQVAFTNRVASSGKIRSFGVPREGDNVTTNGSGLTSKTSGGDEEIVSSSPSTAIQDGVSSSVNIVESSDKKKKEYREPWDYNHSYYPITLPLRPPYSGDPELLDEMEFGEAAGNLEYKENTVNPASELGLLVENDTPRMLFLQLPTTLPLETPQDKRLHTTPQKEKEKVGSSRQPLGANGKGKEKMGEVMPPRKGCRSNKGHSLENLPKGHMGKLLVYKSGAIKWKIGEVIYDVAPGVGCNFAQDVVVMNPSEKQACIIGEVRKRAVVTPDIDSLLNSNLVLGPR